MNRQRVRAQPIVAGASNTRLLPSRTSFLQPDYIWVVGGRDVQSKLLPRCDRWRRPRVAPSLDFGMAVGKRKPHGFVVIARRIIHNAGLLRAVGIPLHQRHKAAIIDAVFTLIQQHKSLHKSLRRAPDSACRSAWSKLSKARQRPKSQPGCLSPLHSRQPSVHREAAHPRNCLASEWSRVRPNRGFVGGAFPNGWGVATIGRQGTLRDVLVNIPVDRLKPLKFSHPVTQVYGMLWAVLPYAYGSRSRLSSAYILQANVNCFELFIHWMACALVLAFARAGNNLAARIAIMMAPVRRLRRRCDRRKRDGHVS